MRSPRAALLAAPLCTLLSVAPFASSAYADDADALLNKLHPIKILASTVPANGDINPYGVAIVPRSKGRLQRGHVLVSNFNNKGNMQGTGTTIVDISPDGSVSLFAQISAANLPGPCPGGVGLTTALVVLKAGWVVVGSLPTSDGTAATAQAGCLIVLDSNGRPVETFSGDSINGPWDMTAADGGSEAALFFTNVLNGTVAANGSVVNQGTVVRMDLELSNKEVPEKQDVTVIASGFPERTDPAALVIGPTGLGLGFDRSFSDGFAPVLYVADTVNNRITVVNQPLSRDDSDGVGDTLFRGGGLNGPLGLAVTSKGNVLTVNSNDGFITEIAPNGFQVAHLRLDNTGNPPGGAGTLFGLATIDHKVFFVDDGTNTLNLLQ